MFDRLPSELRFRLRALFRRRDMERELDDELRFHLERDIEARMKAGVPRDEAERLARLAFGGLERIREDTRDARGVSLLEQAAQDIRYAVRALRSRPVFTAGVVLTLALGIGVNAAMFGIVDRLLFRAPPTLREPETVHRVYRYSIDDGEQRIDRNFSYATYRDLQGSTPSITRLAAFQTRRLAVGEGDAISEVRVTIASADFFRFFDAVPALGRFFTADDDIVPGGTPVVVLGYDYWRSRFGGRNVVGERLRVDRTVCTIIGVAPQHFVGMADQGVPAAYLPITLYASANRGDGYVDSYQWSWLELLARRRPGVHRAAAEAALTSAFRQSWRTMEASNPAWGDPDSARVRAALGPVQLGRGPLAGQDSRVALWISGVALIVLPIACANVANLLLSRTIGRRRELAMRMALGAGRGRLMRQLLIESLVLAVLGGTTGLALAQWGAAGLRRWFLPAGLHTAVFTDGRTLAFTLTTILAVALLTGIVSALHAARGSMAAALKAGGREGGYERSRTRTALLVLQPALSVVLLVGAGLFLGSLRKVQNYRLGYDIGPVVYAEARSRGPRLDDEQRRVLNDRMLAAARSMPEVQSATPAASVPFWTNEGHELLVPGVDSVDRLGRFILQAGSPDYFRTMGTRILRGRAFDEADGRGAPHVAVVSEGMARVLWPAGDAIGQRFRIDSDTMPWITVVGIAEEMRIRTLNDAREFTYYLPAPQYPGVLSPQVLMRVRGSAPEYVNPLRSRLQTEMPADVYIRVMPLGELVDPTMQSWRFGATMFSAFGALALLLAAVGLYSVIAYDVAQRTRDLGVRIALGASVSRIVWWVLGRGLALVASGILLGGAVALWIAPRLDDLLFHQPSRDPAVFGTVAAALLFVGAVAAAAPALRAARVDPNVALRGD